MNYLVSGLASQIMRTMRPGTVSTPLTKSDTQ